MKQLCRFLIPRLRFATGYSTLVKKNTVADLLAKLDKLTVEEATTKRDALANVFKQFISLESTIAQDAIILDKFAKLKAPNHFFKEYIQTLETKLGGKTRIAGSVRQLVEIAQVLARSNNVCHPLIDHMANALFKNIDAWIPDDVPLVNDILELLSVANFTSTSTGTSKFPKNLFISLAEYAPQIKPQDLVMALYWSAKLGIVSQEPLQDIARLLNYEIAKGTLSTFDKVAIARAFALAKYEHITFFRHLAKELEWLFEQRDMGKYSNVVHETKDDENAKHHQGIGRQLNVPTGVVCEHLPLLNLELREASESVAEEAAEFTGQSQQIYTNGQVLFLLDCMLLLRIHHKESYFKRLLDSAMKHCVDIEHLDPEQLRCCISLASHGKRKLDADYMENATRLMVHYYSNGQASNSQVTLFFKELVKQTRTLEKFQQRGKILFKAKFQPQAWINEPLNPNIVGGSNIMESFCTLLCQRIHTFSMFDLSTCVRCIAYLGFNNASFYNVLVPFFKENILDLSHVDIANITQAYNKIGTRDVHLFHLLGKQHQLYLNKLDRAHSCYVKRLG